MTVTGCIGKNDWFPGGTPDNVILGKNVYIDTSYAFAAMHSKDERALVFGDRSGAYLLSSFVLGPAACVSIGDSTIVNGTYIVCEQRVDIGRHCLLSWGTFITDSWPASSTRLNDRKESILACSRETSRPFPQVGGRPVTIEENVWVGFDSVIMPGVTLGRGCVIGSRTVIDTDVPPYAVVVGSPPRIIRYLEPTDRPAPTGG
jgi:acetyltransferase-like isoleucine patch superfamily enzyme